MMKITPVILSLFILMGCSKNEPPVLNTNDQQLSATIVSATTPPKQYYLALGDSYTIGESVSQQQSFPYQLVTKLNLKNKNFEVPTVIAKTGWTTSDLQKAIVAAKLTRKYNFVSLLIGVNNQYQGLSKTTYRTQFRDLLNTAIQFADGKVTHVSVISVPDWGLTPYGKKSGRDQAKVSADIDAFNAINREETLARGASYTNITPASRKVTSDPSLVASDGLHYSAKMYTIWVDAIIATFNRDN
ncbi:SGNH/GDSL hydrolase family protein [Arcticibacter eurypsychrophilus]|uniref:SGNH/GDSL hydrolase family protein n=1 Tax=Arcticibacter eurypsychrophilus TaxID=1434752 RepID=UPI001FDEA6E6|nr:SGNH/GDSL hydrolase family protein [Arcticibacter eurypsychrophilus]